MVRPSRAHFETGLVDFKFQFRVTVTLYWPLHRNPGRFGSNAVGHRAQKECARFASWLNLKRNRVYCSRLLVDLLSPLAQIGTWEKEITRGARSRFFVSETPRSFTLLSRESKTTPRRMKYHHPNKLQYACAGIPRPCCSIPKENGSSETPSTRAKELVYSYTIVSHLQNHRTRTSVSWKERDRRKSFCDCREMNKKEKKKKR